MSLDKDYILKKEICNQGMSNTILDQFDLSWHRGSKVFEETITKSERGTHVVDDKTVLYKYNSNFFRSNEFTKTPSKPHVLFSGCSQTEGIGGNLETVWPTIFLKNCNLEDKTLYSLARSGWGWQMIMDNIRVYIREYSKPDYLFILLPNISRRFEFDTVNKNDYCYMQRYPKSSDGPPKKKDLGILSTKEYFESLMNFVVGWRFFLDYCKYNDINVLWSTWYFNDLENLKTLKMLDDSYVDMNIDDQVNYVATQYELGWEKTNHDLKKRDGHAGTLINMYYANCFLKTAKEKWNVF